MASDIAPAPDSQVPLDTIPISPPIGFGQERNGSIDATANSNGDITGKPTNGDKKDTNGDATILSGEPGASLVAEPEDAESRLITVFDDAENFTVKHPLDHTWTLWFTKPPSGKGQDWNELLKELLSFDTVEEFWGIYNNITPASELGPKSDYHLFKQGVRPEWEDPQNRQGGRWAYTFKERKPNDQIWLRVLMDAIGEQLEEEGDNEVMGVVINLRKAFYRICLWTRTSGKGAPAVSSREKLERIGKRFKESLDLPEGEVVEFMGHSESANAGSSRAKPRFSV